MERFFGVLIEHYGGAFPVWLAPVQAVVLPIGEAQFEYARSIVAAAGAAGFRVEADESNERLQKKIKMQQGRKIPYMLVVGKSEVASGEVNVRTRTGEQSAMTIQAFLDRLAADTANRV